jgi:urate oxidase
MLAETAYGKSRVRLVKVARRGDRHDLTDLTVAIRFEGGYDRSYTDGDNHDVLPTDTMKNTVYALAARHEIEEPETFGVRLAEHFLERNPKLRRVRVDIAEHQWGRIAVGSREDGQAFVSSGGECRTGLVQGGRDATLIGAGIRDLVILKSSKSEFRGFVRDEFTTLPEVTDRLLATALTATWHYRTADLDFNLTWRAVRKTLLETFAEHESRSVQHTLYAMGRAVLDSIEAITAVHLVMPNKHHLPVDLQRFGLQNRNEIFVPTDEPYGLIEATVTR